MFITITANRRWARGKTALESISNASLQDGDVSTRAVYKMPPGAVEPWVDQMGQLRWDWASGADTTGVPRLVVNACRGLDPEAVKEVAHAGV